MAVSYLCAAALFTATQSATLTFGGRPATDTVEIANIPPATDLPQATGSQVDRLSALHPGFMHMRGPQFCGQPPLNQVVYHADGKHPYFVFHEKPSEVELLTPPMPPVDPSAPHPFIEFHENAPPAESFHPYKPPLTPTRGNRPGVPIAFPPDVPQAPPQAVPPQKPWRPVPPGKGGNKPAEAEAEPQPAAAAEAIGDTFAGSLQDIQTMPTGSSPKSLGTHLTSQSQILLALFVCVFILCVVMRCCCSSRKSKSEADYEGAQRSRVSPGEADTDWSDHTSDEFDDECDEQNKKDELPQSRKQDELVVRPADFSSFPMPNKHQLKIRIPDDSVDSRGRHAMHPLREQADEDEMDADDDVSGYHNDHASTDEDTRAIMREFKDTDDDEDVEQQQQRRLVE